MHASVTPTRAVAPPGSKVELTVTITNSSDVISGHLVRVLGVDPRWVTQSQEQVSLFPGATGTCTVELALPPGLVAGERRVSLLVRELTGEQRSTVLDVDLDLPELHAARTSLEPATVTGGRRASFGIVVRNDGNVPLHAPLRARDDEAVLRYRFVPPEVTLAPGEHAAVELVVRGRRRWFGSPLPRPFTVHLPREADPSDADFGAAPATFVQRPLLGRGALSMLGLLAAVTVFGLLLTTALTGVVGRSASDRDLALQVAQLRESGGAGTGTASLSGTARLLTTGEPAPGVTAEVFAGDDVGSPLLSVATDVDGTYALEGLPAGSYKLRFRGAGLAEVWYPAAPTDADATALALEAGGALDALDVQLGGLPALLSGTVTGADPSGTTVSLLLPGTAAPDAGGGAASSVTSVPLAGAQPAEIGALVRSAVVGPDGAFALTEVPSPAVYDLAVSKAGFATVVERVDVGGGEQRTGLELRLQRGDGAVSGTVSDADGPVAGATVSAQYGTTTVQTTSLSGSGAFVLRGLPTPGAVTLVVSAEGRASETLALTLAPGQSLTGVQVSLGGDAAALSGTATVVREGAAAAVTPATGVTVVVTDGALTVRTVTSSAGRPGSWSVEGLPVPGSYTVTFSRPDLASQTVAVALDAFGRATSGATDRVDAALRPATLTLRGTTRLQPLRGESVPAAEVSVTITSGATTYAVTSASVPRARRGAFEVDGLAPGTWTVTATARGTRPTSQVVTLVLGEPSPEVTLVLPSAAAVRGVVRDSAGQPVVQAEVRLYVAARYPQEAAATTLTDASGAFAFETVEAPQTYVVEYAFPPGSGPRQSARVVLEESQEAYVELGGAP